MTNVNFVFSSFNRGLQKCKRNLWYCSPLIYTSQIKQPFDLYWTYFSNEGWQNIPPPNMLLWHVDPFELNACGKQKMQEHCSFFSLKNRSPLPSGRIVQRERMGVAEADIADSCFADMRHTS